MNASHDWFPENSRTQYTTATAKTTATTNNTKMFTLKSSSAALAAALLLTNTASAAPSPDRYSLVTSYTGQNFFNGWSFWDQPDPTNGFVEYLPREKAMQQSLAGFIYNNATGEHTAYMGVDHTTVNPTAGRASVRITSEQAFSGGGLFVADVRHTPQGACGSWPALWLVGPDWPRNGEIDMIEGVNELFDEYNSITLHTGPGCASNLPQKQFTGEQVTTDCDVSSTNSNIGCSIRANATQSVNPRSKKTITHATSGKDFNKAGGGVYATLWDASGIKIYMFPRTAVPKDVVSGNPDPASWTAKPLASFGGESCDYTQAFRQQQLVINTSLCGMWAGNQDVWDASACKAQAPTCQEYVASNPAAFKDVFWELGSIKVYQTAAQQQESGTSPIANGNGKRAEFPASLGGVLPDEEEKGEGEDADCMHMAGTSTTNSMTPTGTATAATVSATLPGYGNSTNFTALQSNARRGGRMARLHE